MDREHAIVTVKMLVVQRRDFVTAMQKSKISKILHLNLVIPVVSDFILKGVHSIVTVKIDADEEKVDLRVDGDIYQEHAECLRDMALSHARRGIKNMDIELCHTYYINSKGRQCLWEMKKYLEDQGVLVTLKTS
jgi:hypothetical protein